MDEVSGRLNTDERGLYLGAFDTGDRLFIIYRDGSYEVAEMDLNKRFDPKEIVHISKFNPETPLNVVYYEGERGWTMVKRFLVETTSVNQRFPFLTENRKTQLLFASCGEAPRVRYKMRIKNKMVEGELDIANFIEVKGWKAIGNKLTEYKVTSVMETGDGDGEESDETKSLTPPKAAERRSKRSSGINTDSKEGDSFQAGHSLEFDLGDKSQGKLFDD